MEGGGAPNNFTICYKDANASIRKVETNPSPRIAPTVSPTPNQIGPGSYTTDIAAKRVTDKYNLSKQKPKDSNWDNINRFTSL